MSTKAKQDRAKNAAKQRAFQTRRKAEDAMVQAVLDTGGVQYELTPVSPSDGGNPLRDGIRTTFVLSQEAKDAITAYAASVRNMTFDKFVETMMAKLVGRMLADGFFQCDYRMKATMLSRLLPDSTAERRTVLDHLSPEIQQQLADDMKFRVEPTDSRNPHGPLGHARVYRGVHHQASRGYGLDIRRAHGRAESAHPRAGSTGRTSPRTAQLRGEQWTHYLDNVTYWTCYR